MTNKQKIREACIKANPVDLGKNSTCSGCKERYCICNNRTFNPEKGLSNPRVIRLADVLLATQGKRNGIIGVDKNGYFIDCDNDMNNVKIYGERWNLKENNLENQSEETINFIAELLK